MLTGCIYIPECAARVANTLTHTFGCIVYWPAWVFRLCCSFERASDGLNGEQQMRIPRFFVYIVVGLAMNPLTNGYKSEHTLTDASKHGS